MESRREALHKRFDDLMANVRWNLEHMVKRLPEALHSLSWDDFETRYKFSVLAALEDLARIKQERAVAAANAESAAAVESSNQAKGGGRKRFVEAQAEANLTRQETADRGYARHRLDRRGDGTAAQRIGVDRHARVAAARTSGQARQGRSVGEGRQGELGASGRRFRDRPRATATARPPGHGSLSGPSLLSRVARAAAR